MEWNAARNRGRPPTRGSDDIKQIRTNWMQEEQNRKVWKQIREDSGQIHTE